MTDQSSTESGPATHTDIGTGRCPVVHFDHHSPEFAAEPWTVLSSLRATCPVARSDAYGGFWVISRYDDIKRIALDDVTFSSAQSILIPAKQNSKQRSIPIETDPPLFLEYRRVMQSLFAPVAVDRLEPAIEAFVSRCIDEFIEKGECDLVHELADPLPAMTTLHKLGLPIGEWARYAEPLHKTVFLRQGNPKRDGVLEQLGWIRDEEKILAYPVCFSVSGCVAVGIPCAGRVRRGRSRTD